jgi:hypothetical protein
MTPSLRMRAAMVLGSCLISGMSTVAAQRAAGDLTPTRIRAYDCATQSTPRAGQAACVEVGFGSSFRTVPSGWQVSCRVGARVANAVVSPAMAASGQFRVERIELGVLPQGSAAVACTVDSTSRIAETSETNNELSATIQVAAPDSLVFDVALVGFGKTAADLKYEPVHFSWPLTVKNTGTAAIRRAETVCRNDRLTLLAQFATDLAPGASMSVWVDTRNPRETIAPGTYRVTCDVAIRFPDGASDAVAANNRVTADLVVPPPAAPDLQNGGLTLFACDMGTVKAGETYPVCVTGQVANGGGMLTGPWSVRCEVAGQSLTIPGPTPLLEASVTTVRGRFANLPAGRQTVTCTLDPDQRVAERNENNNSSSQAVTVAARKAPAP